MGSKEPQKYILIEPTTLQDIQAWATNEVVERPLFKPFDEGAIRKQIFEDKELFRLASLIGCDGEDWQIERRKNNLVDYVFSLITGETK